MNRSSLLTLRAEGLALGGAATALYWVSGESWWLYGGLLLAPDLAMAGYGFGPRVGAAVYNTAHSTLLPIALSGIGWFGGLPVLVAIALVWLAHIGFDRALGYGLKDREGFRFTHLGTVGADPDPAGSAHLRKQSTW